MEAIDQGRPGQENAAAVRTKEARDRTAVRSTKPTNNGYDDSKIGLATPEALLAEVLGECVDQNFLNGLILQIKAACMQDGKLDRTSFEFTLSVIKGNKPRDQNQMMLIAQMAAVHRIIMTMTGVLANSTEIFVTGLAARLFITLTKTFAVQLEALARCRAEGGHQAPAKNSSVSEGGQAAAVSITDAKPISLPSNEESEQRDKNANAVGAAPPRLGSVRIRAAD